MSTDQIKSRLQLGMVLAVLAWGIYLAVGAVNYNADYRKGVIILTCTVAFLLLWASAYAAGRRHTNAARDEGSTGGWNFASAVGFLLAAAASGAMAAAAWGGWHPSVWGFPTIFAAAAASAISSIVGLSNVDRQAGKWLGLVALGLLAAGFVIGFYV